VDENSIHTHLGLGRTKESSKSGERAAKNDNGAVAWAVQEAIYFVAGADGGGQVCGRRYIEVKECFMMMMLSSSY
jgi:hypothetical protein